MNEFNIASHVSHVEANRSVKDAVMLGLRSRSPRGRISVTDLLSLKQAYFRRKFPDICPPLERQQVMWSGTGFHELFGAAVSREEYLEQFVEWEGVVGKIDIFEDVPVEVKTTSRITDESDLPARRPSYIEQLGMYCAMVGVPEGRIVIYQRSAPSDGCAPLSVCCVRFNDLEVIKAEIHRRRELLERALASGDPSALPVCPWGHWGCDYSAVCDCKTSRVPASHVVLKQMVSLEADEAAARELLAKLAQRGGRPKALRLNDIVFPRKAYYERLRPEAPADEEVQELETRGQLSSMQKWGSTSAVLDALRYGPSGGCRRAPVALDSLKDMVQFHQERPTIVRTSPFRSIVERERLAQTCSHYVLRLGFECALAGESRGRLVMYYSNVPRDDAKLMVYDISFGDIGSLRAEAASRVHLLEIGAGPAELPPCPSWMAKLCSYSPGCGCGEAQPRMW